jgi:gas vesicle protein
MDEDKRLSYFFLGLGIGVAVGILFAPKSGEETRELIRSKAGEGGDYLRRRSGELKESASEIIERGKESVQRRKEQVAAAVDAGRQAYRESVATAGNSES